MERMKVLFVIFCLFGITYFSKYTKADESECKCTDWSQWSEYGGCTKHCGGGLQVKSRNRKCESTVLFDDDDSFTLCPVNETFPRFCNTQPCEKFCTKTGPINAVPVKKRRISRKQDVRSGDQEQLLPGDNTKCQTPIIEKGCDDICSSWSSWYNGTCSVRCGGGSVISSRTRSCAQSPGCSEKDEISHDCNVQECAGCNCLDWANWSDYGYCSATCGIGIQTRTRNRSCFPIKPGDDCSNAAKETETAQCSHGLCCDETCTEWSEWDDTQCSATCDRGSYIRTRTRVCSLEDCYYFEKMNASCKIRTCESTCQSECGQWSGWLNGACSVSCGGGISIHSRSRHCPIAFNDCIDDIMRVPCNTQTCPKPLTCDEACTDWSSWNESACSASCDMGNSTRLRYRTCNITGCKLEESDTQICKLRTCQDTCNKTCNTWQEWVNGECSAQCDAGTRKRTRIRTCKYPDCFIKEESTIDCKEKTCEETCTNTCSSWELVANGSCSVSCDRGHRIQMWNRTCNFSDCVTSIQTKSACMETVCKETCDKYCTAWGDWFNETCSVTCGGGQYVRQRLRGCPTEKLSCPLSEIKHLPCNNNTCPDTCDSRCTAWSDWVDSNCSSSCDGGIIIRQRLRGCPVDIDDCFLREVREIPCNTQICTETCDAQCSQWGIWVESACSVTCDGGTMSKHRSRSCPTDINDCTLTDVVILPCNNKTCKDSCDRTCSSWGEWHTEDCSVTCGGGQLRKRRARTCRIPDCEKIETSFEVCNAQSCTETIKNDFVPDCKSDDRHFYSHPVNCRKYYQCVWGKAQEMECPEGTAWNKKIDVCDHIWNVHNCS